MGHESIHSPCYYGAETTTSRHRLNNPYDDDLASKKKISEEVVYPLKAVRTPREVEVSRNQPAHTAYKYPPPPNSRSRRKKSPICAFFKTTCFITTISLPLVTIGVVICFVVV